MKKIIFIFTFTFLVFNNLNAQWKIIQDGFIGGANNLDFVNDSVGWINGWGNVIHKTNNAGENWNSILLDDNMYLYDIDFINESTGWATGSDGVSTHIIKSEDGGNHWIQQKELESIWLGAIYATDENHVYTAGNGKVFKTINGGADWIDVSPDLDDTYYNSVYFLNPDTGVVIGNYYDSTGSKCVVFKTMNGGDTWNKIIIDEFYGITDLQFLNDSSGYFIANTMEDYFLCKTEDIFESWIKKSYFSNPIFSYQFIDTSIVFGVILDSLYRITKSTDGGSSWHNTQSFQYALSKVYFLNYDTSFLLGDIGGGNSILYKSTDSGLTWVTKKFSFPYLDVHFINKYDGFIGGAAYLFHGTLSKMFYTTDSGVSWNIYDALFSNFRSIFFIDDLTGFYLTFSGIFKSTNAGQNWYSVYANNFDSSRYNFYGNDMCFSDEETGWVAGGLEDSNYIFSSGILGTKDRGIHWNLEWTDSATDYFGLKSVCFSDTIGWAVGENGVIIKYTPQNGWRIIPPVTDLTLNKIVSVDNVVWISGGYLNRDDSETIFLKSTDYGQTWIKDETIPYLVNDMYFFDQNRGWAVGRNSDYNGVILKTTNGGDDWETVVDDLICPLNSIAIKDNYGWAVGDCGFVLRNTDAGITWIDGENNETQPVEFMLEQNYPNPFNPGTIIGWQLPEGSKVTLKIYDVLGNEVTTLINEYKPAGRYEVEFNPVSAIGHLASGIYFYRLTAGSYISTKKMILLK